MIAVSSILSFDVYLSTRRTWTSAFADARLVTVSQPPRRGPCTASSCSAIAVALNYGG